MVGLVQERVLSSTPPGVAVMMPMVANLPAFRYHPDPLGTGSIIVSGNTCIRCQQARGHVYAGPTYAETEIVDELCPWCVADGSAAAAFDASFIDVGFGVPVGVSAAKLDELEHRTPGFNGWQQEQWLYHCNDAAAFLGPLGQPALTTHPEAVEMLLHANDSYGWSPEQSQAWVEEMTADGSPTAYLFRCLSCHSELAYADMD